MVHTGSRKLDIAFQRNSKGARLGKGFQNVDLFVITTFIFLAYVRSASEA